MGLAETCVRRPVTSTMFFAGVVILGSLSWFAMPRELFPSLSFPQLQITTRYGSAAPEEIENLLTKVIEESVGTVPKLRRVKSLSKEGISSVTLEFDWGTDMGFAHLSTREKIDQIKDRLPNEAEEPIIGRVNPFAQPMMIYSVTGALPLERLTVEARRVIKQRLEKVDGVASVIIIGGREPEIQVEVDRQKSEAAQVSLANVVDSLKDTNLNYPAGTVQGRVIEYLVRTMGEYEKTSEIARTVVRVERPKESDPLYPFANNRQESTLKDPRLVHLDAVAEVRETFKDRVSYSRHDGEETLSLSVQKQADANTVTTARRVRAAVEELKLSLPRGLHLSLAYDESVFILASIRGLVTDALVGGLLAFGVLYFFLRRLESSFVAALTIPVSASLTFAAMYFSNISINMMSLAGISLAVGSLVDNAIVCMENVTRHRESLGKDAATASIDGTAEVTIPMLSSALTNVAVFMPLVFAQGVAQKLFFDLFFSNSVATMGSWFVAITLIPMLISQPWKKTETAPPATSSEARLSRLASYGAAWKARWQGWDEKIFALAAFRPFWRWVRRYLRGLGPEETQHWVARYRKFLGICLDRPGRPLAVVGGIFTLSLLGLLVLPRVFMPTFDQGQFLLKLQMPIGTRLDVTNQVAQLIEGQLSALRDVKSLTTNVGSVNQEAVESLGSHQAQFLVELNRRRATQKVIADLKDRLDRADLQGGEVEYILQGSAVAAAFEGGAPVVIELKGPDLPTLKKMSDELRYELSGVQGLFGVKSTLAPPSVELRVSIDKDRAAAYRFSVADIARTALIAVKGVVATTFKVKGSGEEIDVRVQLRPEDRTNLDSVRQVTVRQPQTGLIVPLGEVATIERARGPSEIRRLDQQRSVVITANILKRSSTDVLAEVQKLVNRYNDIADYTVTLTGESRQMRESFGGLFIAVIFAILLNYMIMAAEFEDFVHPLIVLATIPLGLIGVVAIQMLTWTPLSAPAILGFIMLAGMVVNNGIVLVDFTNILRRSGQDLRESVLSAAATRFRPIVMSNLTSVLGVLPLALGLSEGSELTSPIAVVSVGGLTVSAILTLIFIPLFYFLWEGWKDARSAHRAQGLTTPPERSSPL